MHIHPSLKSGYCVLSIIRISTWTFEHCGYASVKLLIKCISLISGSRYGRDGEQHKWYLILYRYAGSLVRTQCSWANESPHQRFMPGIFWILNCLACILLFSNAHRDLILSNLCLWSSLPIYWKCIKRPKSIFKEVILSCMRDAIQKAKTRWRQNCDIVVVENREEISFQLTY